MSACGSETVWQSPAARSHATRDVGVPGRVHGNVAGISERVAGAVAGAVDDLGDLGIGHDGRRRQREYQRSDNPAAGSPGRGLRCRSRDWSPSVSAIAQLLTVPAAVPSLFHSSAPLAPSVAWKNIVPFTVVR